MTQKPLGKRAAGATCPACGSTHILMIEGCATCGDCGYSKCS